MSLVSMIFGSRSDTSARIGTFEMDVTIEEQHERSAFIAESPVEDGSAIADHIILDPERITIEGIVSAAPVNLIEVAQAFGSPSSAGFARVITAFDALDKLWRAKEPVTVITGYRTYTNMVIERLSLPRNRELSLRFRADLKKIEIVKAQVLTGVQALNSLGTPAGSVADQAAPTTDVGRQTPKPLSEAGQSQTSFIHGVFFKR